MKTVKPTVRFAVLMFLILCFGGCKKKYFLDVIVEGPEFDCIIWERTGYGVHESSDYMNLLEFISKNPLFKREDLKSIKLAEISVEIVDTNKNPFTFNDIDSAWVDYSIFGPSDIFATTKKIPKTGVKKLIWAVTPDYELLSIIPDKDWCVFVVLTSRPLTQRFILRAKPKYHIVASN